MADAAATAAAGVAIALYIFTDTNDEPIAVPLLGVELRQHTHSGLKALVEPRVLCLGFSTFEVSSGKLHVVDEPEEGLPTRPTGHPLEPTGSAVIAVGKAILLDLGTARRAATAGGAGAAAGGAVAGGGAVGVGGGDNSINDEVLAKVNAKRLDLEAKVEAKRLDLEAKVEAKVEALRLASSSLAAAVDALQLKWASNLRVTAAAPISPTVLGARTWERLVASTGRGGRFTFPGAAGPPVLDESQRAELLAACVADKATGVIRCLTPVLSGILSSVSDEPSASPLRHVLVNSEHLAWLDDLDHPVAVGRLQKPGLFVTWEPFVTFNPPFSKQGDGDGFLFGPLAHRVLQMDGCVPVVVKATADALEPSPFGELVAYHSRLPGRVNGLLFNSTNFWLTEACHGTVFRLEECSWRQPGTRELLRQHFAAVCRPPPLAVLLAKLLVDLDVTLPPLGTTSFLGAGAMARVFSVRRGSQAFVLKVVCTPDSLLKLACEFTMMETAASSGAPVMPVVAGSFLQYPGLGGGYLMAAVGTRIPAVSRDQTRRVFDALQRVHASGVIHGDARLPNVVEVDGSVCWLDFFHAAHRPPFFVVHAREDLLTLAASVLNVKLGLVPASVQAAAAAYVPTESAQAVADAVWAAKC